jgi:pre-mRNA-processing factor 19
LSKSRKKRKNPEGLQSSENISNFAEVDSIGSLHSSTDKGITSLSVNGSLIATGGNDSNIIIHNVAEGTIVSELSGHSKPITSLTWDNINNNLFSTSSDHSSILWKPSEDNTSWSLAHRFPTHKASVTSISLHPCRDYVVTGSMDATWNFNSLTSKSPLASATNPDGAGKLFVKIYKNIILNIL